MATDTAGEVFISDFLGDQQPHQVVEFLTQWVTGTVAASQAHLADHADRSGTTLIARRAGRIAGLVTMRWTSNNPAFAEKGIPLIHQLTVAPEFRRTGIATALLEAIEQLARARELRAVGITVGLFEAYGPAQRLYAGRGYLPDGRGVCRGAAPLHQGEVVRMDHDIILWLVKKL